VPAADLDPFAFAIARHRIESDRQHLAALARVRRVLVGGASPEPQEETRGSSAASASAAGEAGPVVPTVPR
jgi:hypothetical protein